MTAPTFGVDTRPEGFMLSDDVADVAREMIEGHRSMDDLQQLRIAYLLNFKKTPADAKGIHAIARAVKAPDLWNTLSEYDGAVWVQADAWGAMNDRQHRAVVLHELLHFLVDENGRLTVVKHDVEEFTQVVAEYGPWSGGLDQMAEQLRLWDQRADRQEGS